MNYLPRRNGCVPTTDYSFKELKICADLANEQPRDTDVYGIEAKRNEINAKVSRFF